MKELFLRNSKIIPILTNSERNPHKCSWKKQILIRQALRRHL